MIPRIGLYYPYIHFQNEDWLKIAALYWPKMGRIVPPEFNVIDSDVVRALSDELDFVINVAPGAAASELTEVLIDTLALHWSELWARYGVSPDGAIINSNAAPPILSRSGEFQTGWVFGDGITNIVISVSESKAAAELVGLHNSKGETRLWKLLEASGLALSGGEWWGLHPELAWLYTCALADKLAKRNRLMPTTDRTIAHIESLGWTDELFIAALLGQSLQSVAAPDDAWAAKVGQLAVRLVVPADPSNVSVDKIIKVRQRYSADFDAFHDEVAATAADLRNQLDEISDTEILKIYLESQVQRRFQKPIHELEKAMRGVGIETAYSALTTKFELPAGVMLFGGILAGNSVATLSGGAAFGAATLLRAYRRGRIQQMQPSAASYLWHIGRDINPQNVLTRVLGWSGDHQWRL